MRLHTPGRLAKLLRTAPGVERDVADAFVATPRHRFVHWRYLLRAYQDVSLPTSKKTTISQPVYIAKVISAARVTPSDRVLEVGTGSGWSAAILARLAGEVVSVECDEELARRARKRLRRVSNVAIRVGDGVHATDGSFDVIFVMAGAPTIPPAYTERLRDGGRLVMPVGRLRSDVRAGMHGRVVRVTRRGDELLEEDLFAGDWNILVGQDGY